MIVSISSCAGGTQSVKFFDLQLSRFTSAFTDVWHYISQVKTENVLISVCGQQAYKSFVGYYSRNPERTSRPFFGVLQVSAIDSKPDAVYFEMIPVIALHCAFPTGVGSTLPVSKLEVGPFWNWRQLVRNFGSKLPGGLSLVLLGT